MPAILGTFKINSVGSGGVVHTGDVIFISPVSTSKSVTGSGGGLTGDFPVTNTFLSVVNNNDPDVVDDSVGKAATAT